MQNSWVFCELEAWNSWTEQIWKHAHNASRYVPPSNEGSPKLRPWKKESTSDIVFRQEAPSRRRWNYKQADVKVESKIRLTFDNMPKNPEKGFLFGSDPTACDIFCGKPQPGYKMWPQTFRITISDEGNVVLDHTAHEIETIVQYGDQFPGIRRTFRWILFPGTVNLIKVAKNLLFRAVVPPQSSLIYQSNVKAYLQKVHGDIRQGDHLNPDRSLALGKMNPQSVVDKKKFWYHIPESDLGHGAYGRVFVVRNASTGRRCAAKQFVDEFPWREVMILSSLQHDHIVRYVDDSHDGRSLLIMEYMEAGNISHQHRQQPFSLYEIYEILHQGLLALRYLEDQQKIHRDIKPENILFKTRNPLHLKLADFGLTSVGPRARGYSGTPLYLAPEIGHNRVYDSKVDIWSFGVVILQLLWGPRIPQPHKEGRAWCAELVGVAERLYDWCRSATKEVKCPDHLPVVTEVHKFILDHMLKINPEERSSARRCYYKSLCIDIDQLPETIELIQRSLSQSDTAIKDEVHVPTFRIPSPLITPARGGKEEKISPEQGSINREAAPVKIAHNEDDTSATSLCLQRAGQGIGNATSTVAKQAKTDIDKLPSDEVGQAPLLEGLDPWKPLMKNANPSQLGRTQPSIPEERAPKRLKLTNQENAEAARTPLVGAMTPGLMPEPATRTLARAHDNTTEHGAIPAANSDANNERNPQDQAKRNKNTLIRRL